MKKVILRELTNALRDIWRSKENNSGGLLYLNFRQYRGPGIELRDGTAINPGDRIGELHLANSEFYQILRKSSSSVQAVMKIKKEMKQEITQLAELVKQKKVDPEVESFFGISIFHQEARLLGFDVKEMKSTFWRLCYQIGQLPHIILFNPFWIRSKKKQPFIAKEIWISRTALLRDFLPTSKS